jgi:imidazolonepropionase
MLSYDTIWIDAHLATMELGTPGFGGIECGAIAARAGEIAWVGPMSALADAPERLATRVIDARGHTITPGLVDPHTHLVFGGNRLADFERRTSGESYEAVARTGGGGIAYTVERTRACDDDQLFAQSEPRMRALACGGVTTVEIKSGYGLDTETELRMLRVARRLGVACGIDVRTTYLGAHTVPPEFEADRDRYLDLVCDVMIPRVAREGLADAVDVFCDDVAFTVPETRRVFEAARRAGLPLKAHADQLVAGGAVELAARYGAISVDHLERTTAGGVLSLAASGTVAVLLPGAYYYLREKTLPPIGELRAQGVPIALATDCNPGTSPICAPATILNMACVLFGLTPVEALAGMTRNAARALGLHDRGTLAVGQRCDLAIWNVAEPAELCYWLGRSLCAGIVVAGEPAFAFTRPSQTATRPSA